MSFVMKGALVEFKPTFLPVPVPNVIVFQYNPETLTHIWSQPEPAYTPGTETSNPLAVRGMPGEMFSFTLAMDAADDIADGIQPAAATAQASGLYSRLAALEMLLYPIYPRSTLVGRVSAAISAVLSGASIGSAATAPQAVIPVTLFIWGPGRVVPVRVTDLTITEQSYDRALNPIHAEAQLSLRVLTPAELAAASADEDVLANLATIAYTYTLSLRQTLAAANLANGAQSIIGLLPR